MATYTDNIVDGGGTPLVGLLVTAVQDGISVATATTDGSGVFTLTTPAGIYILQYRSNGTVVREDYNVQIGDLKPSTVVGVYNITANTTWAQDVFLTPMSTIKVAAGVTLIVTGSFIAPITQIFTGAGTVDMTNARIECGWAEWWGASPTATDCAPAITKAWAACKRVRHLPYRYHLKSGLVLNTPFREVLGFDWRTDAAGGATEFFLDADAVNAGSDDVLVCGVKTQPTPGTTTGFIEGIRVKNIQLRRAAPCVPHVSGDSTNYATGMRVNCVIRGYFEDVASRESSVGFYFGCTIATEGRRLVSERYSPGTASAGDLTRGTLIDGRGDLGNNGASSNASLNVYDATHIGMPTGYFANQIGLETRGPVTDVSLYRFESAAIAHGALIKLAPSALGFTQRADFLMDRCRFDGVTGNGIEVDGSGTTGASAMRITRYYVECNGGGADKGVWVHDFGGGLFLDGEIDCMAGGTFATAGLLIENSSVIEDRSQITDATKPVVINTTASLRLYTLIDNPTKTTTEYAVTLTGVARSLIHPSVQTYTVGRLGGGVKCVGTGCALLEVSGTMISPGAFTTVTAANKLQYNGTSVTVAGTFGTNSLYTGIVA